jgi:hypothetical protein
VIRRAPDIGCHQALQGSPDPTSIACVSQENTWMPATSAGMTSA